MEVTKLFNKIELDLKEYVYTIFNMDCKSTRLNNYSFNVSVQYNENFSNNINFIVKNRLGHIIMNSTIHIKDLDYMKNKLIKEVF